MTSNGITFLHFTDLHVGDQATDSHLYSDTTANINRFKAMVRDLNPQPAFVVATGDLTNLGDLDSNKKLKVLMDDLGIPVLYALGNHDVTKSRDGFYEGVLGRSDHNGAPYDHDELVAGVHVIVLDSSEPTKVGGSLEPEQFTWLDQALNRHPQAPKIVAFHHPPAFENNPKMEWETLRWQDSVRLAEMIRGRNVQGILCGHLHSDRVTSWHGIPVIMGLGSHGALDPMLPRSEGIRMLAYTGFGICILRESGLEVTFAQAPGDRSVIMDYSGEKFREALRRHEQKAQAAE